MIREIRIYWALRVHVKEISREWNTVKMNLTVNSTIQLLGTIANTLNAFGSFVPDKQRVWVAAGISLLQGVSAVLAHFANPDGTSARAAYVPAK